MQVLAPWLGEVRFRPNTCSVCVGDFFEYIFWGIIK